MSDQTLEVRAVSHAGVVVEDVDTVAAFFEGVLGLQRLYRHEPDGKVLMGLAVDEMLIELIQYPDSDPMRFRATGAARMHLGFTVPDFDSAMQRVMDLDVEILGEPHAAGPARFCFLRGPEDLVVEIVTYDGGARRATELFSPPTTQTEPTLDQQIDTLRRRFDQLQRRPVEHGRGPSLGL